MVAVWPGAVPEAPEGGGTADEPDAGPVPGTAPGADGRVARGLVGMPAKDRPVPPAAVGSGGAGGRQGAKSAGAVPAPAPPCVEFPPAELPPDAAELPVQRNVCWALALPSVAVTVVVKGP